jgi:hypothetical protein
MEGFTDGWVGGLKESSSKRCMNPLLWSITEAAHKSLVSEELTHEPDKWTAAVSSLTKTPPMALNSIIYHRIFRDT